MFLIFKRAPERKCSKRDCKTRNLYSRKSRGNWNRRAMSSMTVDCKVVLLGSSNVGKSSLIERYIHDKYSTIHDMDTTGSEKYDSITRMYYRKANAAILCYDVTKQTSFDKAHYWVQELTINEENCRIYLCGTKKDLVDNNQSSREVDVNEARKQAEDLKADLFETSSKTGENVDILFKKMAQDYFTGKHLMERLDRDHSIRLSQDKAPKHNRCCNLT